MCIILVAYCVDNNLSSRVICAGSVWFGLVPRPKEKGVDNNPFSSSLRPGSGAMSGWSYV